MVSDPHHQDRLMYAKTAFMALRPCCHGMLSWHAVCDTCSAQCPRQRSLQLYTMSGGKWQRGVPSPWQAGVAVPMHSTSCRAADCSHCRGLSRLLLTSPQDHESAMCECPNLTPLQSTLSHPRGASALHIPGS